MAPQRWCIAAVATTGTAPGMGAPTFLVGQRMVQTARRTIALATILPPERTHVVPQSRTAMAAKAWVKPTTQRPGRTAKLNKAPMPMGVGEARRFRKTATLHTASIKRPLKRLLALSKRRTVPRLWAARGSTTAPRLARRRMVTSKQHQTAIPTKNPAEACKRTNEDQTKTSGPVAIQPLPRARDG